MYVRGRLNIADTIYSRTERREEKKNITKNIKTWQRVRPSKWNIAFGARIDLIIFFSPDSSFPPPQLRRRVSCQPSLHRTRLRGFIYSELRIAYYDDNNTRTGWSTYSDVTGNQQTTHRRGVSYALPHARTTLNNIIWPLLVERTSRVNKMTSIAASYTDKIYFIMQIFYTVRLSLSIADWRTTACFYFVRFQRIVFNIFFKTQNYKILYNLHNNNIVTYNIRICIILYVPHNTKQMSVEQY